jgi:hypothetical protein
VCCHLTSLQLKDVECCVLEVCEGLRNHILPYLDKTNVSLFFLIDLMNLQNMCKYMCFLSEDCCHYIWVNNFLVLLHLLINDDTLKLCNHYGTIQFHKVLLSTWT